LLSGRTQLAEKVPGLLSPSGDNRKGPGFIISFRTEKVPGLLSPSASEKVPGLLSPSENKPGTFLGRICEWLLMADKGLSHSSWHNFVHRSKADAPVIGKFGPQLADPSNTISQ
jgi:hypothetical protein